MITEKNALWNLNVFYSLSETETIIYITTKLVEKLW